MLLALQDGVLYGPVTSRRYGRSLGINLMPCGYKLCSFSCVYCHYGWTQRCTTAMWHEADDLPALGEIVDSVERAAQSDIAFDQITFSGNGEPTLYPGFPQLVDAVVAIRNTYRPGVRIGLLSNSTGLVKSEVQRSIAGIDMPVFKLDAGSQAMFKAINHPANGITHERIVAILAGTPNIYLQTVMFEGSPSNTTPSELAAYTKCVQRIKPRGVHLYSIDRPVPQADIRLVPPDRLAEIAESITRETGVPVNAFGGN